MELIYSSFDYFTSSLFLMSWQDGAGALFLLIVSGAVIYSGFPVAFGLVGVAILFAVYALVTGGMNGEIFTSFAPMLEKIFTSNTLLALPLFLFTAVIIERAFIAENLIQKFIEHWRQKSEAMLFTVSLMDILVSGIAVIICTLFAPHVALRLPQLLKTKNHHLLEKKSIVSQFSKGPLSRPSFIPITVMLLLVAEVLTTAPGSLGRSLSGSSNGLLDKQSLGLGEEITKYASSDFFIGALVPGFLFVFLYCFFQLCLMFKYPNDYVFKNIEKEQEVKSSSKKELIKTILAPGIFVTIVLTSLLLMKLPIVEVAAIAAIGSIFLAAYKLAPEKKHIYLNTVISFLSLCLISKLFLLEVNKFELSPLNGAVLAISVFFVGYIAYGIYSVVQALMKVHINEISSPPYSFMSEILLDTLEHSSKLITLFIAALLYIVVFKGLGGDQLVKLFYDNFAGNLNLAIIASILTVLFIAKVFTPFVALLITVPILLPNVLFFAKTVGTELNIVWLGVVIIITLQTLGFYTLSMNEVEKEVKTQTSLQLLKSQTYQANIPYILFHIMILTACWLFPQLILGLDAAI